MSLNNTTPIFQFTPNFFANCKIWLKANTGITLSGAPATNGGAVDNWSDSSGNGLNLSQSTSANRPTYRTNILNGYDGVETDGVNDCLSRAFTWNQPEHIFMVWRPLAMPSVFRWFGSESTSTWNGINFFGSPSAMSIFAGAPACSISTYSANTWNVSEYIFNGASSVHKRNAEADVTGNPGATNPDGFNIGDLNNGAGSGVNGQFVEVIGYSVVLSDSRREMVRTYLNSKFAVY